MHVKKGDLVYVNAGKDRGKTGKVLRVIPERDRVVVERINLVKRHERATQRNRQGGIIEREASIHASNVQMLDGRTNKPARTRMQVDKDGKKVRVAVKSGTVFA